MSAYRRIPKPINLTKVKRGIDIRIQAILKYLQEEPNFINMSLPNVNNSIINKTDRESTTLARESIELEDEISNQRILVQQSLGLDAQRPQDLFEARASLNIEELDEEYRDLPTNRSKQTPNKSSQPEAIQSQNSISNSQESTSRKKIQESAEFKIFGGPLNDTINNLNTTETNIQPFVTDLSLVVLEKVSILKPNNKNRSRNETSRSKKQRTTNKQNCHTPFSKAKEQKKNSFSNHFSASRRLYEYFSGVDRVTKIIPQSMIQNMRQEIERLSKNTRKQANENNARARLLKRIVNFRSSKNTDEFK